MRVAWNEGQILHHRLTNHDIPPWIEKLLGSNRHMRLASSSSSSNVRSVLSTGDSRQSTLVGLVLSCLLRSNGNPV